MVKGVLETSWREVDSRRCSLCAIAAWIGRTEHSQCTVAVYSFRRSWWRTCFNPDQPQCIGIHWKRIGKHRRGAPKAVKFFKGLLWWAALTAAFWFIVIVGIALATH